MYGLSKRIYIGLFTAVLLFAGLKFFEDQEVIYRESAQEVAAYINGWENDGNAKDTFSNVLPERIDIGSSLVFYTKNQYVEVLVGGKQIYAVLPFDRENYVLPAGQWHLVDLSERYGGEKITLHFYGKDGQDVKLPEISIGSKEVLLQRIILSNLLSFALSTVLIGAGVIFCVCWLAFRKRFGVEARLWYVGAINIGAGICCMIQTQFLQLLLGHHYELNILLYSIVFLLQYPIMKYTFSTYISLSERSKTVLGYAINTYLTLSLLMIIVCILHWTDICLYEMAAQTVLGMGGILIFLIMFLAHRRASDRRKRRIRLHMVMVFLLGAAVGIDILRYQHVNSGNMAGYSHLMIAAYLGVISFEVQRRFMRSVGRGQESDRTKDMAYFDALTTMGNRMAFMKDLNEINREKYKDYGIGMFDLNNLKMFNDVHGHSAGDYYLIISSEIIQDIFGQKGKIFRIGGDEFCALLKDFTEEEFQKGAEEMQKRMSLLKGPYTKEEMSVAYGYQIFDANLDHDLSNTLERADISMYEIKQKSKRK